jgi:RNA polymerase subunit RPABC4/transcription elongation factor Spt4
MFLFIVGIQPRKRFLEGGPRVCPECGRPAMLPCRVDHYLSLFFIPLFPVRKGEAALCCRECGATEPYDSRNPEGTDAGSVKTAGREVWPSEDRGSSPTSREAAPRAPERGSRSCRACGKELQADFRFCPWCGGRQDHREGGGR